MKCLHDQFKKCGGEIEGGDRNYLLQNYALCPPAGQYFAGPWPRFTGSSSRLATKALSSTIRGHCFGADGSGGARRSASAITAIDRAPFFPTDRTAKK